SWARPSGELRERVARAAVATGARLRGLLTGAAPPVPGAAAAPAPAPTGAGAAIPGGAAASLPDAAGAPAARASAAQPPAARLEAALATLSRLEGEMARIADLNAERQDLAGLLHDVSTRQHTLTARLASVAVRQDLAEQSLVGHSRSLLALAEEPRRPEDRL